MNCSRCQHDNPSNAKFCLECGARLTLLCAKCQSELPSGAKFCLECGEPVASRASAGSRFAGPETYTPKYLAERILTSKTALEGRQCDGLVYASTRAPAYQRAIDRAERLRKRAGGKRGAFDNEPFPPKPKRMRWRTYRRLEEQYEELQWRWTANIIGPLFGFRV